MDENKLSKNDELVLETAASLAGTGVGFVFAGPLGAILGSMLTPVLADISKRLLSHKEKTRIEKTVEVANRLIKKKLDSGASIRDDISSIKLGEFYEGVLLKARESYEEKKVPLLAHLFATAPFTSTPIENMNESLLLTERLSYQQILLIALIGKTQFKANGLDETSWQERLKANEKYDERSKGIYQSIFTLFKLDLLSQMTKDHSAVTQMWAANDIIPAYLALQYQGFLIFNGLGLGTEISHNDLNEVIHILK